MDTATFFMLNFNAHNLLNSISLPRFKFTSMLSVFLAAGFALPVLADEEVNVYSARKEALIKPMLDRFEEESGVTVNLITGSADALLRRLQVEGEYSPADIFITVDAGRLHRAKEAGVLQPFQTANIDKLVPAHLRDSDDYWYSLSQRSRTIFYAKDRVDVTQLSSYEALADEQWKGRICVRSSGNIYNQSLVASMIEVNGEDATQGWVKGLMSNLARPPFGGDTDLLKAVATGVCDITIANTYYFGRMMKSDNATDKLVAEKVGVFWANQAASDRGVHMNVSGAGITAASVNKDSAIKLIEFLLSDEAQTWYADVNNEYPVVEGIAPPINLASFGDFRADTISLTKLGDNNLKAVKIMDMAGWK